MSSEESDYDSGSDSEEVFKIPIIANLDHEQQKTWFACSPAVETTLESALLNP